MLIVGLMIPVALLLMCIAASVSDFIIVDVELAVGLLVSSAGLTGVGGYAQVARAAQRAEEDSAEESEEYADDDEEIDDDGGVRD